MRKKLLFLLLIISSQIALVWELPTKMIIFNENSRQVYKIYFNESEYLYRYFGSR